MKKKYYEEEKEENLSKSMIEEEIGCGFCWDKKKAKEKELYFLDAANNMRVCLYCPYCGRKYDKE